MIRINLKEINSAFLKDKCFVIFFNYIDSRYCDYCSFPMIYLQTKSKNNIPVEVSESYLTYKIKDEPTYRSEKGL